MNLVYLVELKKRDTKIILSKFESHQEAIDFETKQRLKLKEFLKENNDTTLIISRARIMRNY